VVKDHLPDEALYMIRYHSFYAAHKEGAYGYLMNEKDRKLFSAVRDFNPYDLYSKTPVKPDVKALRPYYEDLIAEFCPPTLSW
jgi:inositol oxygenase